MPTVAAVLRRTDTVGAEGKQCGSRGDAREADLSPDDVPQK